MKMKGSGFSLQGILYIFFIVLMLGLFISASFYIGLNVKKIILEERIVVDTKNAMEITETALGPAWFISFVQAVFAAGQEGFGNEYWYRRDSPTAAAVTSIPAETDISDGLKKSILPYFNLPGTRSSGKRIDINGINVEIRNIAADFSADIANGKITSRIASTVKAFSGLENDQRTTFSKRTAKENAIFINLQKLINAGKRLADKFSSFRAPSYSGPASAYLERAKNQIKEEADGLDLSTKTSTAEADLLVPSTLSGLYLHYNLLSEFSDDPKTAAYDYLNEAQNTFEKKPFSLAVKAEDYLVALDCSKDRNRHTYSTQNDMACDGGKIYTCNTPIQGIGNNLLTCSNGIGRGTGNFGCGESGFKTRDAVDESQCYCTAFGGNWIGGESWTCPRTVKQTFSDPMPGWSCEPIKDKDDKVTGYSCTTTVQDPRSCPMECDLNGRFCTPNRC